MTGGRTDKPDTEADGRLKACLVDGKKRSFVLVAGAGSGKTTSLVKALDTAIRVRGKELKLGKRRVACITYTEIAAAEIWADVGNNPLIDVSTIHSFLWSITRSFQTDIKDWVLSRIGERIAELQKAGAEFGPRVQQRTKDKNKLDIERYEAALISVAKVASFSYGTGSDYPKGILGHDDIIRMAARFMTERPLFRTLLAQQFPIVFVDESQDTQPVVVEGLKAVAKQAGPAFCLGFFGDPMQRIYPTGTGLIDPEEGWELIPKEQNFRCPTKVLAVANAIRKDGDELVQTGGRSHLNLQTGLRETVEGSATIFVLPADEKRDQRLVAVRQLVADKTGDPAWVDGPEAAYKLLVIVHRMAAKRLGFGDLYASMNDKAPDAFGNGFLDATAWPLNPFKVFVLPVVEAIAAGNEFAVMAFLRKFCPRLERSALGQTKAAALLASLRTAVLDLDKLMTGGKATVRDVLLHLDTNRLLAFDPKLSSYLGLPVPAGEDKEEDGVEDEEDDDDASKEVFAMDRYLACPAGQLLGYRKYIQQLSPFSTQQGIKGTEFDRVLVVLDDEEGTHVQFSYDKYFGVKPLSKNDLKNIEEGKETSVERTRRLFYVCCTRALKDLVVVYFSSDPVLAEQKVREAGIFPDADVLTEAAFG